MTTKNPITGDLIQSKSQSKQFQENYDKIFRKSEDKQSEDTKQKQQQNQ